MTLCPTTQILSAYHDGEIDVATADDVRGHVAICRQCQGELDEMKALSMAITDDAEALGVLPIELWRIQSTVRMSIGKADASASLRRTAAFLGAMAASVLIIATAWLVDLERTAAQVDSVGAAVAVAPDWERLASTLHTEPRPGIPGDMSPYSLRYAVAVDWMLRNHVPSERKPWEKPL